MAVFTLFHQFNTQNFQSDFVDDQRFSKEFDKFVHSINFNILTYRNDTVLLNLNETRDYAVPVGSAVSDWWVIYAKVTGMVRFSLRFDDPNSPGATLISKCDSFGDSNFPGWFTQSLKGLKSSVGNPAVSLLGLQNNSLVQILIGRAAADNDASWIAQK